MVDDDGDRRSSWADEAVFGSETGLTGSLWGGGRGKREAGFFFPSAGEKEGNKSSGFRFRSGPAVAAQCRGDAATRAGGLRALLGDGSAGLRGAATYIYSASGGNMN